ncbi:MAG: hypothetical protein ACLFSC_08995 [Wenzhouxiangella sp.]
MLPIARKHAFHIPHSLAAIAAGVCLVIAFGSDFSQRQQQLAGTRNVTPAPVTALIKDAPAESTPGGEVRSKDPKASGRSTTVWIPWFPGLGSGRG